MNLVHHFNSVIETVFFKIHLNNWAAGFKANAFI